MLLRLTNKTNESINELCTKIIAKGWTWYKEKKRNFQVHRQSYYQIDKQKLKHYPL